MQAFSGCRNLRTVEFLGSCSIGTHCFAGCDALISVVLPEATTVIPDESFRDCKCLSAVYMPPTVTEIGEGAFASCGVKARQFQFLRTPHEDITSDSALGYAASLHVPPKLAPRLHCVRREASPAAATTLEETNDGVLNIPPHVTRIHRKVLSGHVSRPFKATVFRPDGNHGMHRGRLLTQFVSPKS